jgi:hypothetical protein
MIFRIGRTAIMWLAILVVMLCVSVNQPGTLEKRV